MNDMKGRIKMDCLSGENEFYKILNNEENNNKFIYVSVNKSAYTGTEEFFWRALTVNNKYEESKIGEDNKYLSVENEKYFFVRFRGEKINNADGYDILTIKDIRDNIEYIENVDISSSNYLFFDGIRNTSKIEEIDNGFIFWTSNDNILYPDNFIPKK